MPFTRSRFIGDPGTLASPTPKERLLTYIAPDGRFMQLMAVRQGGITVAPAAVHTYDTELRGVDLSDWQRGEVEATINCASGSGANIRDIDFGIRLGHDTRAQRLYKLTHAPNPGASWEGVYRSLSEAPPFIDYVSGTPIRSQECPIPSFLAWDIAFNAVDPLLPMDLDGLQLLFTFWR